ncbi:MAG: Ldh family oxidoreductase [Geminicoccaceae bacterium]|nr:MAG: Ldh family oxidoreductase [Geminicoccaceae bacterium]
MAVEDATPTRVDHRRLERLCVQLFRCAGLSADHAGIVGAALVETDLRGVYTHGVIRLPFYVRRLQQGGDNPNPTLRIERETMATAVFDGDRAPGHVVSHHAMQLAIEKAKAAGIGYVAAKNSGHFGAAALWSMMAIEHDMIGVVWTNGPPVMAAWGGKGAAIGNNPLSLALPAQRHPPLVFDGAFSKVAGGKVRLAAKKGERVPDDWIVDAAGNPSTDPNDLPNGGALLPLGYKGYGLAVAAEALAGLLPGGAILDEIPMWFQFPGQPTRISHVMMALHIEAFSDVDHYKRRVDELIDQLRGQETAAGATEVLVPGEIEHRMVVSQRRDGVELPRNVVEDLRTLRREFGLTQDWDP